MNWRALVAGLAMCCLAPFAQAQVDTGYYFAVDYGQTTFKDACETLPGTGCRDNDTASRFSLGYQFNRFLAGEFGYFSAGNVTFPGGSGWALTSKELHYMVVFSLPLGGGYSLFARGGATVWEATSSIKSAPGTAAKETGVDAIYGAGMQYDITKSLSMRITYEAHKIGDEVTTGRYDVYFFSGGLVMRF